MYNRYTVAKDFSETDGKHIVNLLKDMANEMRDMVNPENIRESNLKWLMTIDTFTWLVHNCDKEYGFKWKYEFSSTGENKCTIMGIGVAFKNSETFRRSNLVELTYVEPVSDSSKQVVYTTYPYCIPNYYGRKGTISD